MTKGQIIRTFDNFAEAYPEVAANPQVRALAHDLLTHGYPNDIVDTKVHACSDTTGIDAAVLWDVLPELCSEEADALWEKRVAQKKEETK